MGHRVMVWWQAELFSSMWRRRRLRQVFTRRHLSGESRERVGKNGEKSILGREASLTPVVYNVGRREWKQDGGTGKEAWLEHWLVIQVEGLAEP